MKKFNSFKITAILNKKIAAGIGFTNRTKHFEQCGIYTTIVDFDRGGRHDGMTEDQIEQELIEYRETYKKSTDYIVWIMKKEGYSVEATLHMDDKGWCFIDVDPAPESKIDKSKNAPKQNPGQITTLKIKMGIIETIRTAIFAERLTKIEILEVLTSTFPEKDSAKMAKTISAQLPSRIVKSGQEMDAKKNVKGIQTYKLFTK